nr:PREDICTED: CCR4-NOT transcription complex subunit 8-like [Bos mutus]
MYSQDSIDLLANSGLQFQKHEEEGIDTLHFAELLMTSGVVLCDNVKWLSFHSGYDFGYMVKLLTDSRLPEEEHEFFHILNLFFPSIYDVKYLMKSLVTWDAGSSVLALARHPGLSTPSCGLTRLRQDELQEPGSNSPDHPESPGSEVEGAGPHVEAMPQEREAA